MKQPIRLTDIYRCRRRPFNEMCRAISVWKVLGYEEEFETRKEAVKFVKMKKKVNGGYR